MKDAGDNDWGMDGYYKPGAKLGIIVCKQLLKIAVL
jgi:hypothetical protein